jgi:hypothetical protein
MSRSFASGKNAWAICQRSGLRFLYREMVREPGTGLWVHYSESDGMYNRVTHPQLHIKGVSDRIGLEHPFPDNEDAVSVAYLTDVLGSYITIPAMFGVQLYIETSTTLF